MSSIVALTPTAFMVELHKLFLSKGLAEGTADNYVKSLFVLNNKKPFKTLGFLRHHEDIANIIAPYALSTKKTYLNTILHTLYHTGMENKPIYKGLKKRYEIMLKELEDTPVPKVSEKQKENWIPWEDIVAKREELETLVEAFPKSKLSQAQYDILLQWVILSLYTLYPPRRNKDYQNMVVTSNYSDTMPKDRNYLSIGVVSDGKHKGQHNIEGAEFIFNDYKTASTYGTVVATDLPPKLRDVFNTYLDYHPQITKGKLPKSKQVPLLVHYDGSPFTQINTITRILNRTLGKKVGSSMLRHIYLSHKYGKTMADIEEAHGGALSEQAEDASKMGHSVTTQNSTYILPPAVMENLVMED